MTTAPWYGNTDEDVRKHGAIFVAAAQRFQAQVPISPAKLDALEAANAAYVAAYQDHLQAQTEAKSAKAAKDAARKALIAELRELNKKVRISVNATNSMIHEFGMKPRSAKSKAMPTPPTDLVATYLPAGGVRLRWRPNGNIRQTSYLIERWTSSSGSWTNIGVSIRRTFTDMKGVPGEFALYRVRAQRGGIPSSYSETACAYASLPEAA